MIWFRQAARPAEARQQIAAAAWRVRTSSIGIVERQLQLPLASIGFQVAAACCQPSRQLTRDMTALGTVPSYPKLLALEFRGSQRQLRRDVRQILRNDAIVANLFRCGGKFLRRQDSSLRDRLPEIIPRSTASHVVRHRSVHPDGLVWPVSLLLARAKDGAADDVRALRGDLRGGRLHPYFRRQPPRPPADSDHRCRISEGRG